MTLRQVRWPISAIIVLLLTRPPASIAESGATLTPDRLSYMVSKDIATDRWTINLNLSTESPPRFLNASGNIFRSDGGPPSFVLCQIRPDSTGTLSDPDSTFRFTCTGSDPCQDDALGCSQRQWREIPGGGDVAVPANFFLPPGGGGSAALAELAGPPPFAGPAQASDSSRGSTLSSDGYSFLVNKDVGPERWSISLNLIPRRTPEGGITTQVSSVTGNVFQPDGGPPRFIYCTERPESSGSLADASSVFRLACLGTDACTTTASECAETGWRPIAGEVDLPASFFLPPGGLPDLTFSDPEIVVIGRTSDPPSIVSPEYRLVGASTSRDRVLGGGCPISQACVVPQLGSCPEVSGTIVFEAFCGCQVTDVPIACISCGSSAGSGACGSACEFSVGTQGIKARGFCLPYSSGAGGCVCFAVPSGGEQLQQGCGGTLGGTCPDGRCCTDDPRDGCDASSGGVGCAGLCVIADGADAGGPQCVGEPPCGNGRRDPGEPCEGGDLGGNTCDTVLAGSLGTLACTSGCTFDTTNCVVEPTPAPCGNSVIEPGEECDGDAFGGESCQSRGFCGGALSCTSACRIDDQGCGGSGALPNGATCPAGECCASGVCAAALDDPSTRRCITCPKLNEECNEAACCDPFGQLECRSAAGSSFCCVGSQFACASNGECCSGQCQAGICQ